MEMKWTINPIIAEHEYVMVRTIVKLAYAYDQTDLLYQFLTAGRRYYTMDQLVQWLGISRKTAYRILNPREAHLISHDLKGQLTRLLYRIYYRPEWAEFKL